MLDKDKIKKEIDITQIEYLLEKFGGDPVRVKDDTIVALTIDHNHAGEGSRKLYYYHNQGEGGLFKSYTGDIDTFDIFDLIIKIYKIQFDEELDLPSSMRIVCSLLGIVPEEENAFDNELLSINEYLSELKSYDKLQKTIEKKRIEFKIYEDNILKNLPQPIIDPWLKEGITREVQLDAEIRYNPKTQAIVIPFRDDEGNLIGIRERTLIKENEDLYGKYRPSYLCGKLFNHPLGLSLYHLNLTKENIKRVKKVIVFEGEKSALKYASLMGADNDISVATCGSALSAAQIELLRKYNAEEIIIAFDRDFEQIGDDTFKKQIKNLKTINKKFSSFVKISFLWDKEGNKLSPHESPIDKMDKNLFLDMFRERVVLT